LFLGEDFAGGTDEMAGEIANFAMKAFVGQGQAEGIPASSITRCQRLTPA